MLTALPSLASLFSHALGHALCLMINIACALKLLCDVSLCLCFGRASFSQWLTLFLSLTLSRCLLLSSSQGSCVTISLSFRHQSACHVSLFLALSHSQTLPMSLSLSSRLSLPELFVFSLSLTLTVSLSLSICLFRSFSILFSLSIPLSFSNLPLPSVPPPKDPFFFSWRGVWGLGGGLRGIFFFFCEVVLGRVAVLSSTILSSQPQTMTVAW